MGFEGPTERRQRKRAETKKHQSEVASRVLDKAAARGMKIKKERDDRFYLDGVSVVVDAEITGGSWGEHNGKVRLVCGDWRNKKQFPQRKDGFPNIDGALDFVAQVAADERLAREREAKREAALAASKEYQQLRKKYGFPLIDGPTFDANQEVCGVKIRIHQQVSFEVAEAVLKLLEKK